MSIKYTHLLFVCTFTLFLITQTNTSQAAACAAGWDKTFTWSPAPTARKWSCIYKKPASCPSGSILMKSSTPPYMYSCKKGPRNLKPSCPRGTAFSAPDGKCIASKKLSCPSGYFATQSYYVRSNNGSIGTKKNNGAYCMKPQASPNKYAECPSGSTHYQDGVSKVLNYKKLSLLKPIGKRVDTCKSRSNPNIKYPTCKKGSTIVAYSGTVDYCAAIRVAK